MNRQEIIDTYGEDEDILFADGLDDAIVGVDYNLRVVYDIDSIIEILMERDKMTDDEAIEFAEFNIFGAYVGEKTPVYIYT
jgi:hypothetical protein